MGESRSIRALIIGGGIGGLTAAIALRWAGIEATVFERAHDLQRAQFGSGFFLWTNALRALQQLDLDERVVEVGAPIEWFKEYTARGASLAVWPVGQMARQIGAPSVCVSRADLHPVLVEALEAGTLQLDAACTGFAQDAAGVTAHFADGREERGDLLIGADGVGSVIRGQLSGRGMPHYAGYTAWHAIIDFAHPQAPRDTFNEAWGRGARFIHYPVGGGRHYLAGFMTVPQGSPEPAGGWRAALLACFQRWMEPVKALIAATPEDEFHRTEIYTQLPLKRWGAGRVTLLGDAAHPMTPNLGQGACQAIEDAVVLAKCLHAAGATGDLPATLRNYEARRRGRTASIVMRAWGIGATGRLKHPVAVMLRDRISKVTFNGVALQQQQKDMAYEV